jgi:hypothetical protein
MSAMAVSPAVEGGEWDYDGKVTTHVFTNVIGTFDVTFLQIYAPDENNAIGSWTKVRHGLTGGTTWSEWGEWSDALSKSQGGTVTAELKKSGETTIRNGGNDVVTHRELERNNFFRGFERAIYPPTNLITRFVQGTVASTSSTDTYSGAIYAISSQVGQNEYAAYDFPYDVNLTTGTNDFDVMFAAKAGGGYNGGSSETYLTMATIASSYGELLSTDDGIQVQYRSNVNEQLRILTSDGATLQDTGWFDADIPEATNNNWMDVYGGYLIAIIERTGFVSLWGFNEITREMLLMHRETGITHDITAGKSITITPRVVQGREAAGAGNINVLYYAAKADKLYHPQT